MQNLKFIGVWTQGLMNETSGLREKIEIAFNSAAKKKEDWFYTIKVEGKEYFVANNGEFGYTAMLPSEY